MTKPGRPESRRGWRAGRLRACEGVVAGQAEEGDSKGGAVKRTVEDRIRAGSSFNMLPED